MMNHKFFAALVFSVISTFFFQLVNPGAVRVASTSPNENKEPPSLASASGINLLPAGIYFKDDFEDGTASQWTTHGPGTWTVLYDSPTHLNVYQVDMGVGGYLLGWSTAGETDWDDYIVELDAYDVSGAPNLLFGVRYSETKYSGYTFIMRTDLNRIYLVDDVNFDTCYPNCPVLQEVPFDCDLQTWYHVKIRAAGPRLQFFINDTKLMDYTLQSPYRTSGVIAITGWTGAAGSHVVRFDNVVVRFPYDCYLPMIIKN